MVEERTAQGARLAPFYDLMSTTLYAGLSEKFAFAIGGEYDPGDLKLTHIQAMAEQLGFKKKYVSGIAAKLAENLVANIANVAEELLPVVSRGMEKRCLTGCIGRS